MEDEETLEEIKAQKEAIDKKYEDRIKRDRAQAIEDVKYKIKEYKINPTDVRNAFPKPRNKKGSTTTKRKKSSSNSDNTGEEPKN